METILYNNVQQVLNRLHAEASKEMGKILLGLSKAVFRKLKPEDMRHTYIAITPEQGQYIYNLLVEKKAKNIIEFGTSFGISTLYLGAAAKINGGHVITTEILPDKCAVAQQNFAEAGLRDVIDLREGDALETLKDAPDEIDFLLMDGWNDLYLPLIKLLEPKLKKGAIIYTDNASMPSAKPFIKYLQSNPQKYKNLTLTHKGGAELTEVL